MQVVIVVRRARDPHYLHHAHEDNAVDVRLLRAFLTQVVDRRRHVLCDRRQQLCGGETRIDAEFAIEDFCVDDFEVLFFVSRGSSAHVDIQDTYLSLRISTMRATQNQPRRMAKGIGDRCVAMISALRSQSPCWRVFLEARRSGTFSRAMAWKYFTVILFVLMVGETATKTLRQRCILCGPGSTASLWQQILFEECCYLISSF